jgi:hypothetical protein
LVTNPFRVFRKQIEAKEFQSVAELDEDGRKRIHIKLNSVRNPKL